MKPINPANWLKEQSVYNKRFLHCWIVNLLIYAIALVFEKQLAPLAGWMAGYIPPNPDAEHRQPDRAVCCQILHAAHSFQENYLQHTENIIMRCFRRHRHNCRNPEKYIDSTARYILNSNI
jgi:hypothetical protein